MDKRPKTKEPKPRPGKLTIERRLMDSWNTWRARTGFLPQVSHKALFAWMCMDFETQYRWNETYHRWLDGTLPSIVSRMPIQPPPAGVTFTADEEKYLEHLEDELDADHENTPPLSGTVEDAFRLHRTKAHEKESLLGTLLCVLRGRDITVAKSLLNMALNAGESTLDSSHDRTPDDRLRRLELMVQLRKILNFYDVRQLEEVVNAQRECVEDLNDDDDDEM